MIFIQNNQNIIITIMNNYKNYYGMDNQLLFIVKDSWVKTKHKSFCKNYPNYMMLMGIDLKK